MKPLGQLRHSNLVSWHFDLSEHFSERTVCIFGSPFFLLLFEGEK